MNQKLAARLMRFERDGRRSFTLHLRTANGPMGIDAFCPNGDGNIRVNHFTDILTDLVQRRAVMEYELDAGDSLIGIRAFDQPTANGAFSSSPRPQRKCRCWSCEEPLTRQDARTGIVGAVVRTS